VEQIPVEPQQPRPRAFEYFNFFASLTPDSSGGWRRVDKLEDASRGDVMAWRFPTIEPGEDTGHVMILAESPTPDPSGKFFVVRIYDSAAEAHFDDTRMPQGQPSPKGTTGVGSGFINILTDGENRPIAYLFAPPADAEYSYRPIAIGPVNDQASEISQQSGPSVRSLIRVHARWRAYPPNSDFSAAECTDISLVHLSSASAIGLRAWAE